jgi:hypothetical protein
MRLSVEHHEQLQLMSKHPTSELEELIRVLQEQARKSTTSTSGEAEAREVKKYQDQAERAVKFMEEEKQKRLELEY